MLWLFSSISPPYDQYYGYYDINHGNDDIV